MRARTASAVLLLGGFAIAATAVLANTVGLDHNTQWGRGRLLLLIAGGILAFLGMVGSLLSVGIGSASNRLKEAVLPLLHSAAALPARVSEWVAPRDALRVYLLAGLSAILVVVVYVWYVSVGYWNEWPKTTHTYDLLATSFLHGRISLDETPDRALLSLSDPYDPAARKGIQYPWDASLYDGRYYMYWGPVPALLLAGIKLMYPNEIADQYLVFAFILGTFIFSALLLVALWRRFFRGRVPPTYIVAAVLVVGLAGPSTWLLNRPAGYEASIAGGQFFLIAGVYFAFTAMINAAGSARRVALAGVLWALAAGCRAPTLVPIVAMTLVLAAWSISHGRPAGRSLTFALGLVLPLCIGAAALAWYNWARFGSILEFGMRYQLTEFNMHRIYDQVFSSHYIIDNLRNYLINPVRVARVFPFLTALLPQSLPPGPASGVAPDYLEPVTGLLISFPFLVLCTIPIVSLFSWPSSRHAESEPTSALAQDDLLKWIVGCLLASSAASFALLLLFYYPTMRYLEDSTPSLAILAVVGLWEGWRYAQKHWSGRLAYTSIALLLVLSSVIVSSLLAVTSYDHRFLHLNRDLLRQMRQFFGR